MGGRNPHACLVSLANSDGPDAPSHPLLQRHRRHLTCVRSRLPPHGSRWCCEGTASTLCLPLSGFPAHPSPSGYASSICGNLLAERKRAESPWIWIWTVREGWQGTEGSYLAPCCPSPHIGTAQAIRVFLLSCAVLAVVQAKEAERRRQHRAGSARRGFLAGLLAAFLGTQRCCSQCPDPSPKQPAASNPSAKTQGWAVQRCRGARRGSRRTLNTGQSSCYCSRDQNGITQQHFPLRRVLQDLRHRRENTSLKLSAANQAFLIGQLLYRLQIINLPTTENNFSV